jgi:hypothetical protein
MFKAEAINALLTILRAQVRTGGDARQDAT